MGIPVLAENGASFHIHRGCSWVRIYFIAGVAPIVITVIVRGTHWRTTAWVGLGEKRSDSDSDAEAVAR